ncbi:hypothetical protein GCM10010123_22690 [Pilimelia anulata]|uniref:Transmembrane protein n=1 Tax=Pilimelia anulata TaxID=53371 RepID=A0A8J3B3S5_9ACTN|nr:hypothetical protein [Pilimelia anulata]GGJ92322.1 hypothetical protein GCM10010123_22690 [Pilimelia anulata]
MDSRAASVRVAGTLALVAAFGIFGLLALDVPTPAAILPLAGFLLILGCALRLESAILERRLPPTDD